MHLITQQGLAEVTAERWKSEHAKWRDGEWSWDSPDNKRIYAKLMDLNPVTPEGVTRILNDSWVTLTCAVCNREVEAVIVFNNDERDLSIRICVSCLKEANSQIAKVNLR
jgi:hypothetical protein